MPGLTFLTENQAYLKTPNDPLGWIGLILFGLSCWYFQHRWVRYNQPLTGRRKVAFLVLVLLIPVTCLLVPGFRLSLTGGLPPPMLPEDPMTPVVMVFTGLPWMLAAGWLGPGAAGILGFLSGLIQSIWGAHDPFFPLTIAILATLFAVTVQQQYRTPLFRILRHPLAATVLILLIYPTLYGLGSVFLTQGLLENRLDYAVATVMPNAISTGIALLVSSVFVEVIALALPQSWGGEKVHRPSPIEASLAARFLYSLVPLILVLSVSLIVVEWFMAGKSARNMIQDQMDNAAKMAADSVPSLFETGQSYLQQLALDPRLLSPRQDELRQVLDQDLRTVTYFSALFILDPQGVPVAGYPPEDLEKLVLSQQELTGITLAASIPDQNYAVAPDRISSAAYISFLAAIHSSNGEFFRVLIGRSDLMENPFAKSLRSSLTSLPRIEGQGILLDEHGQILYHPDPALVMTTYTGKMFTTGEFYDETAPNGTRQFVRYQPVEGKTMAVVMTVPAFYAQQQAISISFPIVLMILGFTILAIWIVRWSLNNVTRSLRHLAIGADRMASGQLDNPMPVEGEDEIGQLGRAFEQMRARLKSRLDELNRLLVVSQGVASSLEIGNALQPVLEAAQATGASVARVVLAPAMVPELGGGERLPSRFGTGGANEFYAELDEQILGLTRQQNKVVLTNLTRPRMLVLPTGQARPQAILANALRHENQYYGALWIAYDHQHQFSDEEERFLATLAGHAALAAANAHLFRTAEVGRQRLESILASTPDAVLVTDHQNRLLLANPAASQVFGAVLEDCKGQPLEGLVGQEKLVDILRTSNDKMQSVELAMPNGLTYLAISSPVMAENRRVGRVCVLRDVTNFKELDKMKSDFVSSVSHDLRSPLNLINGYITMLEMVGELNDQQVGYVRKIAGAVEAMSGLVNNVLDLSRIEAGIDLQTQMIPVLDTVERVVGAFQLQAAQKRVQLNLEVPAQPGPIIEADQVLLQQALENLVNNAVKYTEPGGRVRVTFQVKDDEVIFKVQDTGIGISPADQQRLFEKFFRAGKKGGRRETSSGLGLAIVKSIAERHGGRVWVESQLGRGSTFYLVLPLRQKKH